MVLHRFHVRTVLRFKQQNNIKYASVFLRRTRKGYAWIYERPITCYEASLRSELCKYHQTSNQLMDSLYVSMLSIYSVAVEQGCNFYNDKTRPTINNVLVHKQQISILPGCSRHALS